VIEMGVLLVVLIIALLLGGLGFAVHVLWWVALIVFVLWLIGFLAASGTNATGRRNRWYRW